MQLPNLKYYIDIILSVQKSSVTVAGPRSLIWTRYFRNTNTNSSANYSTALFGRYWSRRIIHLVW